MTGKELFEKYQGEAKAVGPGSKQSQYAGVLFQSLITVGEQETYKLLEEAERSGKKLDLRYPIEPSEGPSTPSKVILI